LLGMGSAAQAGLMSYTVNGAALVFDDDLGASGTTWTADANLFKTQYDGYTGSYSDLVAEITYFVPTITHTGTVLFSSPQTMIASDFSPSDGRMTWFGAMAWAEWLGIIGYGGASDWRLWEVPSPPCIGNGCTNSELGHLYYVEGNLAAGSMITTSPQLTAVFTNLQNSSYWSGTESAANLSNALSFNAGNGFQGTVRKNNLQHGWAVRPGQVADAPLPDTALLMALGLAGIGWARRTGLQP